MASWKVIAALLADRLAEHAGDGCPMRHADFREHWKECPHCADARAYHAYLKAGGHDFRVQYTGRSVTVAELMAARDGADPRGS